MRTLFLDIETSPTLATVWGLWNQNIAINQLLGNSEVLTWVAKWEGEKELYSGSLMRDGKRRMLRRIHRLLNEADEVVTWNGNGFDLKVLNKEFLLLKLPPASPFKSVDLLATARKKFRFTSNKMDYVAKQLGLGGKLKHRGHEMWLDCMSRKREAFDEMLEYNEADVVLLEQIYHKFVPWVSSGANRSIFESSIVCPRCASTEFTKRGYYLSKSGKYARYQCANEDCGAWFRSPNVIKRNATRVVEL